MKKICLVVAMTGLLPLLPVCAAASSLEERIAKEEQWKNAGLFLLPHRPNYILPLSYNGRPNTDPYPPGTESLDKIESKFQFSFKVPVTERILKYNVATYIAYTQTSFWQTYNKDNSSLFRDTNYEPEFFLQFNDPIKLGRFTNRYNRLGYSHQSNGQSEPLSRSWNRLYAEFVLARAKSMISIKPWYRITGPVEDDSNPDLWKYMGYGELSGAMALRAHELSFMFRNNLRSSGNKGAIELGWAFPLIRSFKGFIQYFNGYGESLLDYNAPTSRISAGIAFSGWL